MRSATKRRLLGSLIVLGLALSAPVMAVDYYVRTDGNDANCTGLVDAAYPGTGSAQPCAWLTIEYASNNVSGGDDVTVAAGTYVYNRTEATSNTIISYQFPAGTAGDRTTITCASAPNCILQQTGNGGPIIGSGNASYITWDGFYINDVNATPVSDCGSVKCVGQVGIIIRNMHLVGDDTNWDDDNYDGVRYDNCSGGEITNNLIEGFQTGHGSGIKFYGTSDMTVSYNTILDSHDGIYVKGSTTGYGGNNHRVHHNWIDAGTGVMDVGLWPKSSWNSEWYQNVVVGADKCIKFWADTNSAEGDGTGAENTDIYNNTFYDCIGGNNNAGVYVEANDLTVEMNEGSRFYNNVFHTTGWMFNSEAPGSIALYSMDHEHNVYYNATTAFSNWSGCTTFACWTSTTGEDLATGNGGASTTSDPLMVDPANDDFRLCTGSGTPEVGCSGASPGINLGVDIGDLDGDTSTTDAINVGAYVTGSETIGYTASGPGDVCGDGSQTGSEVCDDGNTTTETECPYGTPTCTLCNADCSAELSLTGSYCGDTVIDSGDGEQCDDGNTTPGDGCSATCQNEIVAGTYYVRTDGDDATCNGMANASAASAPNCAWATIREAADNVVAGDIVYVQPGTYYHSNSIDNKWTNAYNPVNSGTSGNPITFKADGALGTVNLAQTATETGTAQGGDASTITLAASANAADEYYDLWGIVLTGGTGAGQVRVISQGDVGAVYNGTTKVAYVYGGWTTAPDNTTTYALFASSPTIGCATKDYIVWDGFTIQEGGADGPFSRRDTGPVTFYNSTGCVLRNSEIVGWDTEYGDNYNAVRTTNDNFTTVTNNILRGFKTSNSHGGGLVAYFTNDLTVSYNTIYDMDAYGIFSKGCQCDGAEIPDCQRWSVHHNRIYDTDDQGLFIKSSWDSDWYQNIVYGNVLQSIKFWEDDVNLNCAGNFLGPDDVRVFNNSFYNTRAGGSGLYIERDASASQFENLQLWNNIFSESDTAIYEEVNVAYPNSGTDHQHNVYHGATARFWFDDETTQNTFDQWKAATGLDQASPASITSDPLYVDPANGDLRLCTGVDTPEVGCAGASPAINLGVDLGDLDGDLSTTDNVNAGAYVTGDEIFGYTTPGGGDVCGDGTTTGTEVCDDGNTVTETECPYGTPSCTLCNADCTTELSLTGSYCGDTVIDSGDGEQCDDGNTTPGDGCSATCQNEAQPSQTGGLVRADVRGVTIR